MSKITAYAALTAPDDTDDLVIVDVSDTSMAASGTTKKITVGTLRSSGLQYLSGGGTITSGMITSAISAGYTGMYLDPRYVWDMSGLTFDSIRNFKVKSEMAGSIGWTGNIAYNTSGYIKTDTGSPADGIKVFATTPGGTTQTQGVIFEGCTFVGSHTRSVIHYGGGQRKCGLVNCLVYNTATSSNSYAVVLGSALSDNNSENMIMSFTGGGGLAGGWAALGIGVADQTQRANDCWYYGLATSGGTYGIVRANGGNHTFTEWYDRSNPATASVWSTGGNRMTFIGGEHQNTAGNNFLVTAGTILLVNTMITQAGAQTTTISMSGGYLLLRGSSGVNAAQTWALSGTAVLDLSDPALTVGNATITGSAGTVALAGNYQGSGPVLTSFTGTYAYQASSAVSVNRGTGRTTAVTVSWTPPPVAVRFRVSVMLAVTTAGTNTVATLAFTRLGSVAISANLPLHLLGAATIATAPAANGLYHATWEASTDASGTAVSVTITPTGSTYTWDIVIEQIS